MPQIKLSDYQLAEAVRDFHRDGFLLLKDLLPKEKLKLWAETFAPLLTEHLRTQADPSFRGAQRYYITLPFRPPFADPEFFENETVLALVEKIVGTRFVMCQLASDTPLEGSDYQEIHSDALPLFPEEEIETPSFQLAMNFALCDVTLNNGPTDITRGTHRIKKEVGLQKIKSGEIRIEPLEMKLGDVLLRDVRGLHRGSPNRTDTARPMVVIGYSRSWLLRPEVSIQIPRLQFEKLSPRAKDFLRFNPVVESSLDTPLVETYKAFAY